MEPLGLMLGALSDPLMHLSALVAYMFGVLSRGLPLGICFDVGDDGLTK